MTVRYLVTGSTGYIGRHITRHLLTQPEAQQNIEVFGFNRKNDGVLPVDHFLSGDILTADLLCWFEEIRPDVVFHAVGINPRAPFERQLLVNAEGTRRLLQALVDAGLRPKVVVVGSAAEYGLRDEPMDEEAVGRPEAEYGISKLAQTQVAQAFARRYDLPVVVGRVFNAYGHTERHLVIAAMAAQIAQAEARFPEPSEVNVQNLRSKRDFVHIDDAVDALLCLSRMDAHRELSGQIYNIAAGESVAVSTVLDQLLDLTRLNSQELHQVALNIHGAQKEDISWADISKIRQHTGWTPQVSLEEGLRRELNYWRAQVAQTAPVG
jgi:nucleoside-diphosphate-sugar epimerase